MRVGLLDGELLHLPVHDLPPRLPATVSPLPSRAVSRNRLGSALSRRHEAERGSGGLIVAEGSGEAAPILQSGSSTAEKAEWDRSTELPAIAEQHLSTKEIFRRSLDIAQSVCKYMRMNTSRRHLKRCIERCGWHLTRHGSNHDIYRHCGIDAIIALPRHRVVSPPVAASITKRLG